MALTAPRAVWLRMALLATLLVAAVVVALMIDLPSVVRLRAAVASAGVLGLAGFVLLYVGLALVPVPKNVASIAAGAAFGLGTGFVLVLAAAVLGAIVAFWLARLLGRAAVESYAGPRLAGVDAAIARHGIFGMVLLRLVPLVPYTALNYLAGLTALRPAAFVVGTIVGMATGTAERWSAWGRTAASRRRRRSSPRRSAWSPSPDSAQHWSGPSRGEVCAARSRPMLDPYARRVLRGPLDRLAASVDVRGISPNGITAVGLLLGLGSAGAAAAAAMSMPALVLWLGSRVADGVDGPLARRRSVRSGADPSPAGGFLDIVSDFAVYGASVAGVGIGVGGSSWHFLAVLGAYYLNGTAFLAFSSLAERTGRDAGRRALTVARRGTRRGH